MSIDLLITNLNTGEVIDHVYITGNLAFKKYWQLLCTLLELKWVPGFILEYLTVPRSNVPDVINELDQIKNLLLKRRPFDVPEDEADRIIHAVERVVEALTNISDDPATEIWFG